MPTHAVGKIDRRQKYSIAIHLRTQ